ncbi:MAG TPA: TIGR02757 family protein [Phnomibacter sp.]|nr:TIGR02757 family protein [Phnomibacter sp.]
MKAAMKAGELVQFLDQKVAEYNSPAFIAPDPICIPHLFTKPQDIEIAGFFAAIFAWGNRTTIIQKSRELLSMMDMAPHDFVLHAQAADLRRLASFKHRTFQSDDLYYFIHFFKEHYSVHTSLEWAFVQGMQAGDATVENGLNFFRRYFFEGEHLRRTEKHISAPLTNSSCKRLNMYLRWMVRRDTKGVDFGIWQQIHPSQLICPLDVHVARVARSLQLLQRVPTDWKAALELTAHLRSMDANDPVKYDFALFGLGVMEKFG